MPTGPSAGGAGRPQRRRAQGGLRLDSAPNPWRNSRDWLGLSELEAVTRVPEGTSEPSPHICVRRVRYPNAPLVASAAAVDATAHGLIVVGSQYSDETRRRRKRQQVSRFGQFYVTADSPLFGDQYSAAATVDIHRRRGASWPGSR